jgi:hypothetical protein
MKHTDLDLETIRETGRMLVSVRLNMLQLGLLIEGSSYDKQLRGLTGRCRKAADALIVEQHAAQA